MNEFLSFSGVIALWIGLSFAAWSVYRRAAGTRQQRQIALAHTAAAQVADAKAVFDNIRRTAPLPSSGSRDLTKETHALLKRLQERGAFFDAVNALRPQIRRAYQDEDCQPLAEILHIRRDLWAASEIVLVEDFRSLGSEFAEEGAYDRLREEAVALLFSNAASRPGGDLLDLRLSLARNEALQFVADVERAIGQAQENERLPTFAEMIAYPVEAARALPRQLRSLREQLINFQLQVNAVAATIQQSQTMARGVGELRRAREELPQRLLDGLDKASTAARQSATSLKTHYDFLAAAHSFQAKYEDLLRKAPEMTERGKQFIARLELADKSERLKLTSATARDALMRQTVRGLAHLIAALQRLHSTLEAQASVTRSPGFSAEDMPVSAKAGSAIHTTATPDGQQPADRARGVSIPDDAAARAAEAHLRKTAASLARMAKARSTGVSGAAQPGAAMAWTHKEIAHSARKRAASPPAKDGAPKDAVPALDVAAHAPAAPSAGLASPAKTATMAESSALPVALRTVTAKAVRSRSEPAKASTRMALSEAASPPTPLSNSAQPKPSEGAPKTRRWPKWAQLLPQWLAASSANASGASEKAAALTVTVPPAIPAPRGEAAGVSPAQLGADQQTGSKVPTDDASPTSSTTGYAPELVPPKLQMDLRAGAQGEKASLAAKLTDIAPDDAGDDQEMPAEPEADDAEDDDPGPLTRSILESRAKSDIKPGHNRAFPWLRR